MTDEQLEALYKSAFNESHIAGLRAVWIAAQPVLQETIDVIVPEAIVETKPIPTVVEPKTRLFTKKAKK